MRVRTSRRAAVLVAIATFTAAGLSVTGAGADHSTAPNDDRQWIAQAGNGGGGSSAIGEPAGLPVIEDMNVLTVLYHDNNFRMPNGLQRPGFGNYVAFGLVRVKPPGLSTAVSQLAVSHSVGGLKWSAPQPATLKEPNADDGADSVPFLINEPTSFLDVVYNPATFDSNVPFANLAIYYRAYDSDNDNMFAFTSMRRAISTDGQTWYARPADALTQDAANPVVAGAGCASFKCGSYGPTDVIFQPGPGKSTQATCATDDPAGDAVPSPWNCQWVMLYDATDGAVEQVGIASSPNGTSWRGEAAPLLPVGAAGSWDDDAATAAKVRIRPNPANAALPLYDLYYSGGRAPDNGCFANMAGCWSLGTAISTGGAIGSFAKTPENPVTPRALLEVFGDDDPHTLWAPSPVDDIGKNGTGHGRIYYTRITNGHDTDADADADPDLDQVSRDMFLAYSEPAPTEAPRITLSEPSVVKSSFGTYRNDPATPISFYLTDTLGAAGLIGIDLRTLSVQIDGLPITGFSFETPHLVRALLYPSIRASLPRAATILADGLHTLSVQVADLEGNVSVASLSFLLDTTGPTTVIGTKPADGQIGFPLGSAGSFTGDTTEPVTGTGINRIDVLVTNPLGETRSYRVEDRLITKTSPYQWTWRWVAPTPDLHFALPGTYKFSVRAHDNAGNMEDETADNTAAVMIL